MPIYSRSGSAAMCWIGPASPMPSAARKILISPASRPQSIPWSQDRQDAAMKRGEAHWADLMPRPGSEQTGRRPVVVVSHDGFNRTPGWRSIIVVPISTSGLRVPSGTGGLKRLLCSQFHENAGRPLWGGPVACGGLSGRPHFFDPARPVADALGSVLGPPAFSTLSPWAQRPTKMSGKPLGFRCNR